MLCYTIRTSAIRDANISRGAAGLWLSSLDTLARLQTLTLALFQSGDAEQVDQQALGNLAKSQSLKHLELV